MKILLINLYFLQIFFSKMPFQNSPTMKFTSDDILIFEKKMMIREYKTIY